MVLPTCCLNVVSGLVVLLDIIVVVVALLLLLIVQSSPPFGPPSADPICIIANVPSGSAKGTGLWDCVGMATSTNRYGPVGFLETA